MAESHGYLRLPPDGTGKRVPQSVMMEMEYTNGTIAVERGDVIVGAQSGIQGTILEIVGTTLSGELHLALLDPISGTTTAKVPNNPQFIIGENLTYNGTTFAKAATTGYAFYLQQLNIAGGKNQTNLVEVDRHGSLYTRFTEGAPIFDSFGKMQVSEQHIVAEYLHQYDIDLHKVSVTTTGAGSVTHLPLSSGVLMSVGTGATDKAEMVSHQYHPYRLGQSRLIEFTTATGDTGKANLSRIWGYGDDNDGCFFEQINGVMNIAIRSSVSGTMVETLIPQTLWNRDRVDASSGYANPSGKTVIWTSDVITWIDLQWLGAGTVRFGVVVDGMRIVCHEWHHSNTIAAPYMRTATLPVYHEIKNTGVTASASEFRLWCTVVINEGNWDVSSRSYSHVPALKTINSSTITPLCSLRAKQLLGTLENRKSMYLNDMSIVATNAAQVIEIWKNATLTGATWAVATNDGLDIDEAASAVNTTNADRVFSVIVDNTGATQVDLRHVFNSMREGIRRHFNATNYDTFTITTRRLANTNGDVQIAFNWDDV